MSVHELTIQLVPVFAKHAVIRTLPLNHGALHTSDTHGRSDGFVIWPFFFPLGGCDMAIFFPSRPSVGTSCNFSKYGHACIVQTSDL